MDHDQAEIVRLLNSVNGRGPAEFFRQWVRNDATDWVARVTGFGANIGLGPEISTPIAFETLNEILAVALKERERAAGQVRGEG